MASPRTPRLTDTPVAMTVRTPRLRSQVSSEVPVNGDTPCSRGHTRSDGSGPSPCISSVAGVPSRRWSGLRTMAAMSWQLTVDPAAVRPELGGAVDDGHTERPGGVEETGRVRHHPHPGGRVGQLGERTQVADDPPLDLHGEDGGPVRGRHPGEVDGHGAPPTPPARASANPMRSGRRRRRAPRAPRRRWRRPSGSRACRSGSARCAPPRAAGGAPCSRRCASRQCAWISSSVGTRSPRGWMMAATRWPHRSSGAPTTMASSTSGCDRTADSTSSGKIFSPPELIETEPRPSRVMRPVLLDGGEVAGHRVAGPVDGDEDLRGLDRVVVVADRDVAGAGDLADDPRPRHDRLQVLVEDDGVAQDADRRSALHGRAALGHGGHAVVARTPTSRWRPR